MRESNFAFPALTGACVWNRRVLDTTSPLPLLNSLTHLMYLTSISPRIRENPLLRRRPGAPCPPPARFLSLPTAAREPLRHLRPPASWTSPPAAHSDFQSQIL
ncbi:hypothetical protein DFH11DRAFT_1642816 [Phellopilus nigrolimitatus]|nr:hypothetical protein DFH11DRAFT_1642816 [Phellopilus nigrolimitatus]